QVLRGHGPGRDEDVGGLLQRLILLRAAGMDPDLSDVENAHDSSLRWSATICTTSSYLGEFMKLSTDTWIESGEFPFARSVSCCCVMTRSAVPSRFAIAWLVTWTSSMPAFFSLLR